MRMKRTNTRITALLLTLVMCVQLLPVAVFAQDAELQDTKLQSEGTVITGFEQLTEAAADQTVPVGTARDELVLPSELAAVTAAGPLPLTGITWQAEPEYQSNEAGTYRFTPILPEHYRVAQDIELPVILVQVESGGTTGQSGDTGSQPVADQGLSTLGGISLLGSDLTKLRFDVGEYNILIEPDSAPNTLMITYTDPIHNSSTIINGVSASREITVFGTAERDDTVVEISGNATVNLTLEQTSIKTTVSNKNPLLISNGAKARLLLTGVNTLNSSNSVALAVLQNSELTIHGTDSDELTCRSGWEAAGIGGGRSQSVGKITVTGGKINAYGGRAAAGIGSGESANNNQVVISGGIVNSVGGESAAGIGSGFGGVGGSIKITGGIVNSTGGKSACGIGHGSYGSGGTVEISGGTVWAGGKLVLQAFSFNSAAVKITGGSVCTQVGTKTGSAAVVSPPLNAASVPLYCNELTIGDPAVAEGTPVTSLDIAGSGSYGIQDVQADSEGKVYLWLPQDNGSSEKVILGTARECYSKEYPRPAADIAETLLQRTVEEGDTTITLFDDYYEIQIGSYHSGSIDYSIPCVLSGTSNVHTVNVTAGSGYSGKTVELTLRELHLNVPGKAAMTISAGAKAKVTLSGTNDLTGGGSFPGLYVTGGNSVIITGSATDSLSCVGGTASAGIGARGTESCGKVVITGGRISAKGTDEGAGIGSGNGNGGVSDGIEISGGTILTVGGNSGVGIGTADPAVQIPVRITGGTVQAAGVSDISVQPVGDGITPVYLNKLTVGAPAAANTEITACNVQNLGYIYGMNAVVTDASGLLYLWLPQDAAADAHVKVTDGTDQYASGWSRPAAETSRTLKKLFRITYRNHNGDDITASLPAAYDQAKSYIDGLGLTLPVQTPYSRSGWTFAGWWDQQTGGSQVNEIAQTADQDIELYARWRDTTPPTGQIASGNFGATTFHNTPGYNWFYRDNVKITFYGSDGQTGIDKIEYLQSGTQLTQAEADQSSGWTASSNAGELNLTAGAPCIIYLRITDQAGNQTIISTDWLVVYRDSAADTTAFTFVRGSGLNRTARVTLNGNTVAAVHEGLTALVPGTDYTVAADGTITFREAWLSGHAAGNYSLSISYAPQGKAFVNSSGNDAPTETQMTLQVVLDSQNIQGLTDLQKTYGDGPFTIQPVVSGNPVLSYASSSPSVATISASGEITIVGAGETNITVDAAATSNYDAATKTFKLTVEKDANTITNIPALQATYGDQPVTVSPQAQENPTFTFASDNPGVADIDQHTGVITFGTTGTAVITVSAAATANYEAASESFTVQVEKSGAQAISGIVNHQVVYGEADYYLTPAGYENPFFSFTSSNPAVAEVNLLSGQVTIKGAGTAVVTVAATATANYQAKTVSVVITVTPAQNQISNIPALSLTYGDGPVTISPSAQGNPAFTFTSSDPTVAAIDPATGVMTITGAGDAVITVTAQATANYQTATATFPVQVGKSGDQTITGVQDYQKVYGDPAFLLTLTGYENPVFSYVSDTPQVVSVDVVTGQVTIHRSGTAVITVAAAATANYHAAAVQLRVTVGKAANPISGLVDMTATYGDADQILTPQAQENPVFHYQSSNSAAVSVDSGGNLRVTGVGTAIIRVDAAETANYQAATAQFTVQAAAKPVTIKNTIIAEKVYDGRTAAEIIGSGTIDGLVAGDQVSINPGTAVFAQAGAGSGIAVTFSGFTLAGSEAAKYRLAAQPASQAADIKKARLIVAAVDQSRVFGRPNPELTIDYSGFVNGEGTGQLTTAPLAATAATVNSPTGTYPITVAGGVSDNYQFEYHSGTLYVIADKVALEAAVKLAEDRLDDLTPGYIGEGHGQYPREEVEAYQQALREAEAVLADPNATQTATNQAASDLEQTGRDFLDSIVQIDFSGLQDAINAAGAFVKEDYTAATWEKLSDSLEAAVKLIETALAEHPTQASTDQAEAKLRAAVAELRRQYRVIEDFAEYTGKQPAGNGIRARVDAPHDKFVSASVNGMILDPQNYIITAGSTVITLNEDYVKTLANGTYQVKLSFTDGEAEALLKIAVNTEAGKQPGQGTSGSGRNQKAVASGDGMDTTLWLLLLIGAAAAVGGMIRSRRMNRNR